MSFSYGHPNVTTAAEVSRNFGRWQDEAINGPVLVTHHGRVRVVLISAAQYTKWSDGAAMADAPAASEEALEARLSALLAYTRDSFFAVDKDLTIVEMNRAAEDFHERPRSKLVGLPLIDAFPGTQGSAILERIKRVAASGRADRMEEMTSVVFLDRLVRCEIFPYGGGAGVLFENLTESRDLQRRAEQLDAVAACISAASEMATMTINLRGSIETVSERMVEWLGLRASEVIGLRLHDLFAVEDRATGRMAVEQVFRGLETQSFSGHLLSNSNADVLVNCKAAPIRHNGLLAGLHVLLVRSAEAAGKLGTSGQDRPGRSY